MSDFRTVAIGTGLSPESVCADAVALKARFASGQSLLGLKVSKSGVVSIGGFTLGKLSEVSNSFDGFRGKVKKSFPFAFANFFSENGDRCKNENTPVSLSFEMNEEGEARFDIAGSANPFTIEVVAHEGKSSKEKPDKSVRREERKLEGGEDWETSNDEFSTAASASDEKIIRRIRKRLKRHPAVKHVNLLALDEGRYLTYRMITSSDPKGAFRHLDPRCKDESVVYEVEIDKKTRQVMIKNNDRVETRAGQLAVMAIIQEMTGNRSTSYTLPGAGPFCSKGAVVSLDAALVNRWSSTS